MEKMEQEETIQMKKNQGKNNSKAFNFFNSPIPIFITLALIILVLLFYIKSISYGVTLYSFGGYNDDLTFLNGTIFIGRDVNYFGDSKIKYDGKDIELYDFEIGYYIRREDGDIKLTTINSIEDMKDKGASLKSILENLNLSFSE